MLANGKIVIDSCQFNILTFELLDNEDLMFLNIVLIGPFEYGIPDTKLEQNRKNKPGLVPSFERSKEPRSLPLVVLFFFLTMHSI